MRRIALFFWVVTFCVSAGRAQQTSTNSPVPHFVHFAGVLKDAAGQPLMHPAGVTFALYRDQEGGAPLWLETQNVTPDRNGHYTVSLGATKAGGLPLDLFASGEARWLGMQVGGQPEQARVLLLSVPYALKAADAETVGGLPASAFVLATPGSTNSPAAALATASPAAPAMPTVGGGGTQNFLPLWTDNNGTLGNSALFQLGSGATAKIGVNLTNPLATLDVKGSGLMRGFLEMATTGYATPAKGFNSNQFNLESSAYNSTSKKYSLQHFVWQAEPVANNTANPAASLNLLFNTDPNAPVETGLKISSAGVFTFAPGQTFPGAGTITGVSTAAGSGLTGGGASGNLNLSLTNACAANQVLQWNGSAWACASAGLGTITGVTAGTDLTGGGTIGNVTLSLNTAATDGRYAQLAAANIFTKEQQVQTNSVVGLSVNSGDPAGIGVQGFGNALGVEGMSSTAKGIGVSGYGNAVNGVGVFGSSNGQNGIGVSGTSIGTNPIGVEGTTYGGTAVLGQDSAAGMGVEGVSSSGTGVYGFSSTLNGVYGYTSHGTGVQGISGGDTLNTAGVFGRAGNGTLFGGIAGVWGDADQHVGVFGSSNAYAGVIGESQSGYGLQGISNGADGVNGTSHTIKGSGVAGINDAPGGLGVYGHSNGGFGFYTDSNVAQSRNTGGWVKAMVFVDPFTSSGTAITRCYNSQTGSSTPPCNFSILHEGLGQDLIDFGFQVSDRFISATSFNSDIATCVQDADNYCPVSSSQTLTSTSYNATATDVAFWIIIF